MIDENQMNNFTNARRLNDTANIALTNITAANVYYPKAGRGVRNCAPEKSKACWKEWWTKNESTFTVKNLTFQDRSFEYYPNYGIYRLSQSNNSVYVDFDANNHLIIKRQADR